MDSISADRNKKPDEQLDLFEQEKALVLNSIDDLVLYHDRDMKILWANRAAEVSVKSSAGGLIGRHCWEIWYQRDTPCAECPVIRSLETGEQQTAEIRSPEGREWLIRSYPLKNKDGTIKGIMELCQDITERRRAEKEREITVEFLSLVNQSRSTRELIQNTVTFFQQKSDCEAVGIRLREGDDYPYYEARGFKPEFIRKENLLCNRDAQNRVIRDKDGFPVLDCMCGNVITGRFDPSRPFFTARGSFWTNSTTELLATTTEKDRLAKTRNVCNTEGYESFALIALRVGEERLGVLQLNDRRKGHLTPGQIAMWERLADYLAVALAKFKTEEALQDSEKRYRSLFENMLEGYAYCEMLYDEQGRPADFAHITVNDAFEQLTGLKDVRGKKATEAIPGIKRLHPELFEIYGRVAMTGKPENFEIYFKPLSVWLSISAYSIERRYFTIIFENITERKQAEEALRRSETGLKKSQEIAHLGNWELDLAANKLFWSDEVYRIFGLQPQEFGATYEAFLDAVHPDDRAAVNAAYLSSVREGRDSYEIEHRVVRKITGEVRIVHEKCEHVRDESGHIIRSRGIVHDITEHRQAEEALKAAKAQAELYLDLMGHDINNMHQIALGYLEMARDLPADVGRAEFLDTPIEVLQRSAQLIKNVRKLQKLHEGVFQNELVDVAMVLTEVQREFRAVPHKMVTLNLNGCEHCLVRANELLHDVFANLVSNAIKHTGDHADIVISMDTIEDNGNQFCRVMVVDNGPGIPDDFKDKIFNRMLKGSEKAKGMGLGLYLVRSLVDSYQGRVWVEDRVPGDYTKGARFVVMLPATEAMNYLI